MKIKITLFLILLILLPKDSNAITQTPATNISVVTSSFSKCLNSLDTNVQLSLNAIDACFNSLGGVTSFNTRTGAVTLLSSDVTTALGFSPISLGSLSSGVGINYNNTTGVITNSLPDQTVVLNNGTGINITGTYPTFTVTNTSPSSGGTVTSISTTSPITGGVITGTGTISCNVASGSQAGCLSSTDWNTFNGKQSAGSYITALTGDITASGPGSASAILATVNANTGSFTNANITVNGKGLITSASNGTSGTVTSVGVVSPNKTLQSIGGTNPVTSSGTINEDINWTDLNTIGALSSGTGVNWADLNRIVANTGLNWNASIFKNFSINWSNYGDLGSQNVNWHDLSAYLRNGYFSGNVGIGTSAPTQAFQVVVNPGFPSISTNGQSMYTTGCLTDGGSGVCSNGQLYVQDGTGSRIGLQILGWGSQSADYFDITANGGSVGGILSVISNGNVGINTASPSQSLQVNGSGYFGTGTPLALAGETYGLQSMAHNSAGVAVFGTDDNTHVGAYDIASGNKFWQFSMRGTADTPNNRMGVYYYNGSTYSSELLTILTNGSFGIGVTNPTAYLQVSAATSSEASLNIKSSSATNPSSPNSGDLWWNGTNLYFYNGATNKDLLAGGGGGAVSSVSSNGGNNDPVVSPTTGSVVISASKGSNNNLFVNIMNNQGGQQ